MNHSEKRLTTALRELAASSRQGASPELEPTLRDAFRRHHARRRVRRARIAAIVVCLAALATLPLLRRPSISGHGSQGVSVRTIPPEEVAAAPDLSVSQTRPLPAVKPRSSNPRKPLTMAEFVALPSIDPVPPGNELRVVRLEMPVKALRLVGVPVDEGTPDRRVLADFVVGPDRTPYAVRLVSYPFRRGE